MEEGLKKAYCPRGVYPKGFSSGHKSFPMGQPLVNMLQQIYENITISYKEINLRDKEK